MQHIAAALGARLGRTVTTAEIGFAGSEPLSETFGVEYGADVDQAGAVLGGLLRADQDEARPILDAPALPSRGRTPRSVGSCAAALT